MTTKIILTPEASYSVGFGHAYRLMALYECLQGQFECLFHFRTVPSELRSVLLEKQIPFESFHTCHDQQRWLESNPGCVLVLDGYNFSDSEVTGYARASRAIVKIDDLFVTHPSYDVIVNHSPGATPSHYPPEGPKLALGPKYIMVRKAFLESGEQERVYQAPPKKIFVCFGASDPADITTRVLKTLAHYPPAEELHVLSAVVKSGGDKVILHRLLNDREIKELMRSCDLGICAPSTVSLEACCVGLPLIVVQTASNQAGIREGLEREQAACSLTEDAIEARLCETLERLEVAGLKQMTANQRRLVDRQSIVRFRALFEDLLGDR